MGVAEQEAWLVVQVLPATPWQHKKIHKQTANKGGVDNLSSLVLCKTSPFLHKWLQRLWKQLGIVL